MRLGMMLIVAAMALAPQGALALDLEVDLAARGWFFSADGTAQQTDLDALDFDRLKGQPEVRAGVLLGGRHHLEASYLRIRRGEEGTVTGTILGLIRFQDDVSLDLSVDYVRGHYGYRLLANEWVEAEPFLEIAWINEETTVIDRTLGLQSNQHESSPAPLVGLELGLVPDFRVHPLVRIEGIGTGRGHLIDFLVGGEATLGPVIAGAGYREINFRIENDDDEEEADVELRGLYVEAGVRF